MDTLFLFWVCLAVLFLLAVFILYWVKQIGKTPGSHSTRQVSEPYPSNQDEATIIAATALTILNS